MKKNVPDQLNKIGSSQNDGVPLSFGQERLWFLEKFEPDLAIYNIPINYQFKGPLDVTAFTRSLDEVLRRHGVLRTNFLETEHGPVQKIRQGVSIEVPLIDWCHLDPDDQDIRLQNLSKKELQKPFDLEKDLLIRAAMLRLSQTDHVLLMTVHHIVFDGWSLNVFWRELNALYTYYLEQTHLSLPDLPIQYADFSVWQRDYYRGSHLDNMLGYWHRRLADLPILQLPTDRIRPAVQTHAGSDYSFKLPKSLSKAVASLARSSNATLYITLLSTFYVLLYRYSGQEDIAVGSPIANRRQRDINDLIGFFVNTLVLRIRLSGDLSFKDLLERVLEICLEAYNYQEMPFEKIVESLNPKRDLSRNPLFSVLFALQNFKTEDPDLKGLKVFPFEAERIRVKFDLEFHLSETSNGITGTIIYSTDLWDFATIQRMVSHFEILLEGITANPEQQISTLPLLNDVERHRLLVEWNETTIRKNNFIFVHQLFEKHAALIPDATAVVYDDETLTFQELNKRSNQLSSYLHRLGVGPNVLVGIFIERSLEMVIGVLGIIKAGGAYVPLDPDYPRERLAFMVKDSKTQVLLTQQKLAADLSKILSNRSVNADTEIVCLDADWPKIAELSDQNHISGVEPDDPLYVLYTSGSTGRPKAVIFPHRAGANMIIWQLSETKLGEGAKALQYCSLSFDASFTDIFTCLGSGGTLYMITNELQRDFTNLLKFISRQGIERLNLPYVSLQQLAEAMDLNDNYPLCLREVISTAEQLKVTPHIRKVFDLLTHCSLQNQYGPTETHVVSAFNLKGPAAKWPAVPPIGKPIANTQLYILDGNLQPVPVGVPGYLYIGGAGLAIGYLHAPNLTSERFVSNPFHNGEKSHLYKTGDLARYLPDGNIEFLSRADNQLKIRGYRIEPGEIETLLCAFPGILEALVLDREDRPGDRRLVAHIVKEDPAEISAIELRDHLRSKLPGFMLPSAYVFLDKIPLTPSGKTDRLAIAAHDAEYPEGSHIHKEPQTTMERALVQIWGEVLDREKISVQDNFFDIGGDSLSAARVAARIRNELKIEMPIRSMFEYPTITEFSKYMKHN